MRTRNPGKHPLAIALTMMLAAAIVPSMAFGQNKTDNETTGSTKEESGTALGGVWQTTVTFRDCQTGAPLGSFQALRTFMQGGTLSETNPSFPSSGHGIWEHTSGRKYTVGLAYYSYDPNGEFAGHARIREYMMLSRDRHSYISNSTFEFFDPKGNVVDSGCSIETATRFLF